MNSQPLTDSMLDYIERNAAESFEAWMNEEPQNYNRDQLITALVHEYEFLCHDDFNPETDFTVDEYKDYLTSLPTQGIIDEIYVSSYDDQDQAIDEFLTTWL